MKPYYDIDPETQNIIMQLIEKCKELDLGNVSFSYYQDQIDFYLSENKHGWELVVSRDRTRRDIYKIVDDNILYHYSETD